MRVRIAYNNKNQMHSDCEKYAEIITWLDSHAQSTYASLPNLDHQVDFIFKTEYDAMLFMLRWGGQRIDIDSDYNLDWIGGML